ncbi:hypothetical protein SBV1_1450046 [Verrucomicrobia bacterium]|nr:hypothetical protein SBV1_1450046 [Verrucomicrobiota bacterium]
MKPINKQELYDHLAGFLKTRGIELREGSYAKSIQTGCSLLTDTINLGQQGLERAKTEVDKRLDQMRQIIHEKTAPKSAAASSAGPAPGPAPEPARKPTRKARSKSKSAKKRS